jgi:hypothetical protein
MECCCCFCCQIKLGLVCGWRRARPAYLENASRQKPSRDTIQFCEMIRLIDDIVANRSSKRRSVNLQTGEERRIFRKCIWWVIIMDAILLITTLIWTILSWQSRWWLLIRLGNAFRMILLLATLFQNVNLYAIKGDGRTETLLRHFSIYPSLGIWVLVGVIDYYLIRWPLFIGQALYYFILFMQGAGASSLLLFLFFLLLNFCYLLESHLSVRLVYRRGVWLNILSSLRRRRISSV